MVETFLPFRRFVRSEKGYRDEPRTEGKLFNGPWQNILLRPWRGSSLARLANRKVQRLGAMPQCTFFPLLSVPSRVFSVSSWCGTEQEGKRANFSKSKLSLRMSIKTPARNQIDPSRGGREGRKIIESRWKMFCKLFPSLCRCHLRYLS